MKRKDYAQRLASIELPPEYSVGLCDGIELSMRAFVKGINERAQAEHAEYFLESLEGAQDALNNLYRFVSGHGDAHDIFSDEQVLASGEAGRARELSMNDLQMSASLSIEECRPALEPLKAKLHRLSDDQRNALVSCWIDLTEYKRIYALRQAERKRASVCRGNSPWQQPAMLSWQTQ
jgi:hypothetical protein